MAGPQNRGGRGNHIKKSGTRYHIISTYTLCILRKWGFRQKIPRKVHFNTASEEEKDAFKKRLPRYLWISTSNNNNNKMKRERKIYDSIFG